MNEPLWAEASLQISLFPAGPVCPSPLPILQATAWGHACPRWLPCCFSGLPGICADRQAGLPSFDPSAQGFH